MTAGILLTITIISGIGVAVGIIIGLINSFDGKSDGNNAFLIATYVIAQWQYSVAWGITVLVASVLILIITGLIAKTKK